MGSEPVAKTSLGAFEGEDRGSFVVFKGIPYAEPPEGKRRFRPPEPYAGHRGVRKATEYGPSCPQPPSEMFPQTGPTEQSEDCLYLNIWTPGPDNKARPVMVWIHGGAFVMGSGAFPFYKGAKLASEGIVVVTINYRLGPFGFLDLRSILGSGYEDSANLGLKDQLAAIEWVVRHIENFGGDPDRITIFGESAGGMSVGSLVASPAARGLFSRAICQSGAAHNALLPSQAQAIAEMYCETLCEVAHSRPSDAKDILLRADAELLQKAFVEFQKKVADGAVRLEDPKASDEPPGSDDPAVLLPAQPVIDGEILTDVPIRAVERGASAEISLIAGSNRDEYLLFAPMDPAFHKLDRFRVIHRIRRFVAAAIRQFHGSTHRSGRIDAPTVPRGERRSMPSVPTGHSGGHSGPSGQQPTGFSTPHGETRPIGRLPEPETIYETYESILAEQKIWPPEPKYVWSAIATDVMFGIPALRLVQAQARFGKARLYRFDWESPLGNRSFGSCHALEIPFVFGTTSNQAARLFCGQGEEVERLSEIMRTCWRSFAESDRPAHPAIGQWPLYSEDTGSDPLLAAFGPEPRIEALSETDRRKLQLWEGIL
jgi:carboxylesterase type B